MVVEWTPNNLFIKTVFLLQKLNKMFVILMDRLFRCSVTQVVQLLKKKLRTSSLSACKLGITKGDHFWGITMGRYLSEVNHRALWVANNVSVKSRPFVT